MSSATVEDLHSWVGGMMNSLKITDYKLEVGGNTVKGDGYLGEVTFLTVKTEKGGANKDYNIVIKSAKKSEELRRQTPIKEAYDREIFFYSKLFPILNEFQMQKKLKRPFTNIPKCYCVSNDLNKEAIILQNLKTEGFQLHDRQKPMNLDHVLMVFQHYGRYHALSLAFKLKKPSVFKSITKNFTDVLGQFIVQANMLDIFYKNFENAKKLLQDAEELEALKKYDGFENEFEKILINFTSEDTDPTVLIHGDCWNNNFMFKYEGTNTKKPVDMTIIDFQISRVASPILDLSYFLYCCADKQVLKDFDLILQAYHLSLVEYMSELGCNSNEIFSLKILKDQWKEYGKFGLVIALFLLKVSLCESNEAFDLMETAEKGESFSESFKIEIQNEAEYNNRIKDIYLHFANIFL